MHVPTLPTNDAHVLNYILASYGHFKSILINLKK